MPDCSSEAPAGRPTVLGLIPARGGSKGVPRKNLRLLAGRPLIAYAIDVARAATSIGRVIVSTDDQEIRNVAHQHGAEIPFLRPPELAADDTLDFPVFEHALKWLEAHEGYRPDIVVHLRPTSPFRTAEDIDRAVDLLWRHPEAHAVRSVATPRQNPFKMWRVEGGVLHPLIGRPEDELYNQPRQQLPAVYWQNGCIDVTRYETIMSKRSMTGTVVLPLIMSEQHFVDLDVPADFDLAEGLIRNQVARPHS